MYYAATVNFWKKISIKMSSIFRYYTLGKNILKVIKGNYSQ